MKDYMPYILGGLLGAMVVLTIMIPSPRRVEAATIIQELKKTNEQLARIVDALNEVARKTP